MSIISFRKTHVSLEKLFKGAFGIQRLKRVFLVRDLESFLKNMEFECTGTDTCE
jgi:hypothetical protein